MNRSTAKRLTPLALTASLLLSLAACGDDSPKDDTTATTGTPSDDIDPDDVAGIITDTPKDVQWQVPDIPSSWKKIVDKPGESQWQVGTCLFTLNQPAGLGNDTSPTQDEVLEEFARRIGQSANSKVTVGEHQTSMFPLVTNKENITATTKVTHASITGKTGAAGEIYAYRSGDFALVAITICGQQDTFNDANESEFAPVIDKLAVKAEY